MLESSVELKVAKKIHSKIVIVDDKLLMIGSFNWLSVVRNQDSSYCNTEHTLVSSGAEVSLHIKKIKKDLSSLTYVESGGKSFYKQLYALKEEHNSNFLDKILDLYRKNE